MKRLRARKGDPLVAMMKEIEKIPLDGGCPYRLYRYGDELYTNVKFSALYQRRFEFGADYVYHYTSFDTLEKLISDDADLLLTRCSDLNDDSEFELGIRKVFDMLFFKCDFKCPKAGLLAAKMRMRYTDGMRVPWIMSFSEDGDSLYQWGLYTDRRNGGCAIAYDFREMNFQVEKKRGTSSFVDVFLLPCFYAHAELDRVFELWYSRHREILHTIKELSYAEFKSRQDDLLDPLVLELIMLAAIIKHEGFASEREWRLMILPKNDDCSMTGLKPIELAGKRRIGLNQCFQQENVYQHKWIRGVVVSPHGHENRDDRLSHCSDILHAHGHSEPYLYNGWSTPAWLSSVPYNGR